MVPVPKNGTPRDTSLTPISIMVVDTIGVKKSRILLKVLLYPASTKMLIYRKTLPTRSAGLILLQQAEEITTLVGTMETAKCSIYTVYDCPNSIRIDKLTSRKLSSLIINVDMISF